MVFDWQLAHRHADDGQREDRRRAHGVDVRQRVGRGDAAEVEGVVDHRHEEVGGRHQRLAVVQPPDRGVVGAFRARPSGRGRPPRRGEPREDVLQHRRRQLAAAAAAVGERGQAWRVVHGVPRVRRGARAVYSKRRHDPHRPTARVSSASIQHVDTADAASLARFDAVIDVRSPAEFALGPCAGRGEPARAQRRRAGRGRDDLCPGSRACSARRIGAAYVARNVARPPGRRAGRPAGGLPAADLLLARRQRSHAMATSCPRSAGRRPCCQGGYKTYRAPCARAALRTGHRTQDRAARRRHRLGQDRDPGPAGGARRADDRSGGLGGAPRLAVRRPAGPGRSPARRCSRAGCWRRWRRSIRRALWWSRRSPARSASG